MWFKKLTGVDELSAEFVRENLEIQDKMFVSKVNGEKFCFGKLEIPTLKQLRDRNTNKNPISPIFSDIIAPFFRVYYA